MSIRYVLIASFMTAGLAAGAQAQDRPAVPTTPAASTQAPDKPLVCRSTLETGSLVKRHKTCFTREQWKYVDDQHNGFARDMVQKSDGGS